MNNERRRQLELLRDAIEGLKLDLGELRDEEQDVFDNLPEGLRSGDRGEAVEECILSLDSASADLDSANEAIEEAMQ